MNRTDIMLTIAVVLLGLAVRWMLHGVDEKLRHLVVFAIAVVLWRVQLYLPAESRPAIDNTPVPPANPNEAALTIYSRVAAHLAAIAHRISRSIFLPLLSDIQKHPHFIMSEGPTFRFLHELKANQRTEKIGETKVCVQVFEEAPPDELPALEAGVDRSVYIYVGGPACAVYIASKTGSEKNPRYNSTSIIRTVLSEVLSDLDDYKAAKRAHQNFFIYKLSTV